MNSPVSIDRMEKTIILVANGFSRDNMRLQPWRYIYEIASRLADAGNVIILTDGDTEYETEEWDTGLSVVRTRHLASDRQKSLLELIRQLNPETLLWSTTPRSIIFGRLFSGLDCPVIAVITCPLYSWGQLLRARFNGVPRHELETLMKQRLVPKRLFSRFLGKAVIKRIFTQSHSNRKYLLNCGVDADKISVLPVGIDAEDRQSVAPDGIKRALNNMGSGNESVRFLYLGAVRPIRGFDALMKAFPLVAGKCSHARLTVLARGASDERCKQIEAQVADSGLDARVRIVGGWLSREEVWSYLEACDVVVLPFVIVPSDVPIAILEALSRGKPVIGSPVDGIPELVEGRGVIVDPLDSKAFCDAMVSLSRDRDKITELGQSASEYMKDYPDWDKVGKLARDMVL